VQHVKAFNRFAIIRAIQEHGPISRTALAELTKLSKSSISTITAELLRQQVIGLHSVGESSGGRPATYLSFDASAGYVIGLDLANDPVTILLTDLQAQVRQELHCSVTDVEPDALLATVLPTLRTLLTGSQNPVLGIGVASPGEIDTRSGEVVKAANLRMRHYPLQGKLHEALGCPVRVGNDTNCAALAEKYYGGGFDVDDILYVAVGTGVGAGIIVNGDLFTGSHGFAGEMAHMIVTDQTAPCICGNQGCLEAVAAGPAIARTAWERLCKGEASALHDVVGDNRDACTAQVVLAAAAEGDALAVDVVQRAAHLLARALASLVNVLDIDTVILSGLLVSPDGLLLRATEQATRALVGPLRREWLRFFPGQLGSRANAIGAAMLALQDIFTPQGIDQILMSEEPNTSESSVERDPMGRFGMVLSSAR
jgi:glucokinase-like ROK family protein